jgi:uncharacterized membrane protein
MPSWGHAGPVLAAFGASLVECIEALTVVLAVGAVRGWRGALGGTALALLVLLALVVVFGGALTFIPLRLVQIGLGAMLLALGLSWLKKAVRRAAGLLPLRDEDAAFGRQTMALREAGLCANRFDRVAIITSFKVTMIEGLEVVFIVVAVGSTAPSQLIPASLAAATALGLVMLLGLALHRPISKVPENSVKFGVGILLCAFGLYWTGEGLGFLWPRAELSLIALTVGLLFASLLTVWLLRLMPKRIQDERSQ